MVNKKPSKSPKGMPLHQWLALGGSKDAWQAANKTK
jgi:hypothetical protein